MKLLLDQNLSPHLVARLAHLFPDSVHVSEVGLAATDDEAVWQYARAHGFLIVSKDADFSELSFLRGAPPKVVWIQRGNCTTTEIENLLASSAEAIQALHQDATSHVLQLY